MKDCLLTTVNSILATVNRYLTYGNIQYHRRELAECYMALTMLHDNFKLDPVGKSSIEYVLNKITNEICYIEFFHYYNCFYYLPHKVYNKDVGELSREIGAANINIACFRCNIHASRLFGFSLDSSEDDYFFSRGDRIYKAVNNFIKYPFDFNIEPFLYLILNYYQTVKDYLVDSDGVYTLKAQALIIEAEKVFETLKSSQMVIDALRGSRALHLFWNTTVPSELVVDLPEFVLPRQLNRNELWCLFSLFDINPEFETNT